jgi:uncharacterized protein (DUF305 family)
VKSTPSLVVTVALTLSGAAACQSNQVPTPPPAATEAPAPIVQPGAPGQEGKLIAPGTTGSLPTVTFADADVKFMQGMIGHHSQAIEMTDLLAKNSTDADMTKLGLRISVSQEDEIGMMKKWLETRGQTVPGPHAMHEHGATLMPGMLTADEMSALAAAKGRAFDVLFLKGMIKHHDGALVMVDDLFKSPGAGQESDIFAFASDVVADQKMEIQRMSAMLKERQK